MSLTCYKSLLVLALAFLCTSCAHVQLSPLPEISRIPLAVATSDLTGTHSDSLFLDVLESTLQTDFIYSIELGSTFGGDKAWCLTLAQNPFRQPKIGEEPLFNVLADLERADFAPVSSLRSDLLGYLFLGPFVGTVLSGQDEDTYAAALQYRFSFKEPVGSPQLLVRVAREGNVNQTSRRELMMSSTTDAVNFFLMHLAHRLCEQGKVRLQRKRWDAHSEREVAEKLYQWLPPAKR